MYWTSWAPVWGLGEWYFEDLSYKHPSFFENEDARRLANAEQRDEGDGEEVQTTIISRYLLPYTEKEFKKRVEGNDYENNYARFCYEAREFFRCQQEIIDPLMKKHDIGPRGKVDLCEVFKELVAIHAPKCEHCDQPLETKLELEMSAHKDCVLLNTDYGPDGR